jgi:hypothetical protein
MQLQRASKYFKPIMKEAGIDRLFLVSTPAIAMDFNDAPLGKGREKQHFSAIDAAVKAGVKHIFYTSLAFKDGSQAGVMRAHFRTEDYLKRLQKEGVLDYSIIRMGLYNESWPLYLGHYNIKEKEEREEIVIAGDGPINWTSISDLGLATALILSYKGQEAKTYTNQTFFLSQSQSHTLKQVCSLVDPKKSVKMVTPTEYVEYYSTQRKMGNAMLEWWCSTYPSVSDGLCSIQDSTFESLLALKGKKPDSLEDAIRSMMQ